MQFTNFTTDHFLKIRVVKIIVFFFHLRSHHSSFCGVVAKMKRISVKWKSWCWAIDFNKLRNKEWFKTMYSDKLVWWIIDKTREGEGVEKNWIEAWITEKKVRKLYTNQSFSLILAIFARFTFYEFFRWFSFDKRIVCFFSSFFFIFCLRRYISLACCMTPSITENWSQWCCPMCMSRFNSLKHVYIYDYCFRV